MSSLLATRGIALYLREIILPYLYGDTYNLSGKIRSFERLWVDDYCCNHSQSFEVNNRKWGYFCQFRPRLDGKFRCLFFIWDRRTEFLPRIIASAPERNILGDDFLVSLDGTMLTLGKRLQYLLVTHRNAAIMMGRF